MKKIMQSLLVLLLALSLAACSNTEVEQTTSPTETTETEEVDTNVYVPVGTESLNLDELVLPLDDYSYNTVEVNEEKSDYDLNTKGEYTITFDLKDENGEVTEEVEAKLVVDEKEVVEEKIAAQKEQKERNAKVETDDEELVAKPSNDGKTTTTENPQKQEPQKAPSSNNQTSNNASSSNNGSSGSTSGTNGGLSTNPEDYGLDPNNEWVIAAMNHVGESGRCDLISGAVWTDVGTTKPYTYESADWNDIGGCLDVGDEIVYTALNGDTSVNHTAIYLGNGLALQGNWTGGVARVANAYQQANYYAINSEFDKECGCTSCGFGSNPTSDEEWQAQMDAVDPNVCTVKDELDMTNAEWGYCYENGLFDWQ